MKKVVNAIIIDLEKVLVIKRKRGLHSGKWAFPGGIVNKNETSQEALRREVKEEIGLQIVKILNKIANYEYLRENKEQTFGESYLVEVKDKTKITILKKEILEFKWASLEELEKIPLAPGIEEEAIEALLLQLD